MAIFGSLGKALGLDTPFGLGVVRGLAEGVKETVDYDMKRMDERIDRVSEYKIKKQEEENQRVQTELRENQEKIMGISGKVGGLTGAEYLIRTYGLEEAIKKADQIETLKGMGKDPSFFTKDENQTTLRDLTEFTVSAPSVIKSGTIKDDGFLSKIGLGRDASAEVQSRIDEAALELGTGVFKKTDLGAMPVAKGFDPTDLGMLADFEDEASRQVRLALSAKEAGDEEGYKERMSKANQMAAYSRVLKGTGDVSEAAGRAFTKLITGHIATSAGFSTEYKYNADGSVSLKSNWKAEQDRGKANTIGAQMNEFYTTAVNTHQISPARASAVIHEAVGLNKLPKFVTDADGNVSIQVSDMKLVEGGFSGGMGVYSQSIEPPKGNTVQGTQQQSTSSAAPNVNADIGSLITQHNQATTDAQKAMILGRINRAYGGSQNVPQNIVSQLK